MAGKYIFPFNNGEFLSLSGGTITGNTSVLANFSATTIFSGSTDLSVFFNSFSNTFTTVTGTTQIHNGINTFTGGTPLFPTVNVTGLSIDNIFVSGNSLFNTLYSTSLSGGTIFSGSTDLYNIFAPLGSTSTFVQNGINTFTGGTTNLPTVNITAATLSSLSVSGSSTLNTLSANTISGGTIYSGSTNIANIFASTGLTTSLQSQLNTKANLSGATFTNGVTAQTFTASTISGGTIFSGSTNLSDIITGFATKVQNGINTFTGGTVQFPTVNITAATLSSLSVSGNSTFNALSASTLSGGTIFSGSTNIANIFASTGLTNSLQSQLNTKANLSGATFTNGVTAQTFTATTISGGTLYSGSTNLSNVFAQFNDLTHIQNGINTFTGGTSVNPTVNVTAATLSSLLVSGNSNFNTLSANTISASTFFSGSTNLNDILTSNITKIQNGINTFTGGTVLFPTINVTGLSVDNIFVSGDSKFNSISANTISGGTIYSGSTNIENIFASTGLTTSLQAQLNTKANLSGATFTNGVTASTFTASTISGGTIFSGSTNLSNIFAQFNDLTHVQNGINTFTGGTAVNPSVNITAATLSSLSVSGNSNFNTLSANTLSGGTLFSGSTNIENIFASTGLTNSLQSQLNTKANLSGATFTNGVTAQTFTATTISGGTLFSGSTNLSNIFAQFNDLTHVQNGINTFTGGTAVNPTVNITAATLSSLSVSGNSNFNTLSANTLSGGTLFSGSTNINSLFITRNEGLKIKSGTVSGSTFAGNPKTVNITFVAPFASTSGYTVTITGVVGRTWRYENKTASGFTINSGANSVFTEEVSWQAIQSGEML